MFIYWRLNFSYSFFELFLVDCSYAFTVLLHSSKLNIGSLSIVNNLIHVEVNFNYMGGFPEFPYVLNLKLARLIPCSYASGVFFTIFQGAVADLELDVNRVKILTLTYTCIHFPSIYNLAFQKCVKKTSSSSITIIHQFEVSNYQV